MMLSIALIVFSTLGQNVKLELVAEIAMPAAPVSVARIGNSADEFYVVWSRETASVLARVNLRLRTLRPIREWSKGKDGPYVQARAPGLATLYRDTGESSVWSYVDPESGKILEEHRWTRPNSPDPWHSESFPGPLLPLEEFKVGQGRVQLFWDTPKRRLGYAGDGDVIEFKPGSWEQISRGSSPTDHVRVYLTLAGNPDLGAFALTRYHEGMMTDGASASWYAKDLTSLKVPYDWVFDIGPQGALVADTANKSNSDTRMHPAVDLKLIDPLTGRVKWHKKQTGTARWIGKYVLFWPTNQTDYQVLDGATGRVLAQDRAKGRLLEVAGDRLLFSSANPPSLQVWRLH